MIHRLVGRPLLFSVALAFTACGGGGGGGSVTPPGGGGGGTTTSSTQTFTATTGGPVTVNFGTIAGGITATLQVPPTATGSGSGSVTLSASPPAGTPAVSSAARRPKNVGGTITPLAYFTISSNTALSFAQTPAVSLTTPTSTTYAYIAAYDSTNGWTAVAGPGTLVGGNYVINPTDENYSVGAGQSGVFAIFGSSTLISVDPPTSPISDSCGTSTYRRASNHRLAPRASSQIVPNRLYVSYGGGASTQSLVRAVGAVRSVDLTPTKGVSHTIVTLAAGTNRNQAAATLRAQSGVTGVSVLHTRSILADSEANDPLLDDVDQWYLYRTNTDPGAWNLSHGTGVNVAVIDTGIDLSNVDLTGSKLVFSEAIVDGMVTTSAQDTNGHGTNVAGLATAATNNGYGYAGVGWNVGLLDYKIFPDANAFSDCQGADTGDEAQAIDDAVNRGASVISLSLGSPNDSGLGADTAEEDAVENAISKNVTVVAANGNEFDNSGDGLLPDYPAAYPGVIAVGASAVFDSQMNDYAAITSETVASYSNSDPTLLAPGGDALNDPPQNCSSNPNAPCDILHWIEGYSTNTAGFPGDRCTVVDNVCPVLFNGTSQATPQVAGTVALMEAYHGGARTLTPAQVKTILTQNTDVLPGLGADRQGAGRLDAAKAVAASHS
jgi:hypothetical protein